MAVALRFVMGLIAFVYLQAVTAGGVLLLVLGAHDRLSAVAAALIALGAVLVIMPVLTTGTAISVLRFAEPGSRRWVRRAAIAQGVVLVAGIAAEFASVALGTPWWFAALVVVVGLLLAPAFVALGRAARRHDVVRRSDDPVGRAAMALRRGYRDSAIGFGIGIALATVLTVLLLLLDAGRPSAPDFGFALPALAIACYGGAIGGIVAQLRISRIVREVVGPEYGEVRRIARVVVRGKPETLSASEQDAAAAYSRVIISFLRSQLLLFAFLYAGIVLNEVGQVMNDRRRDPVPGVLLPVMLALFVVLLAVFVLRLRRVRRYASAHALPA